MSKILEIKNLTQYFDLNKGVLDKYKFSAGKIVKKEKIVRAINGINFDIEEGEVFSLVGESGCGKSTTARTVIKLIEPKGGTIKFMGEDITLLKGDSLNEFKKNVQMIFQDPYASLNPRQRVIDIIKEPIIFHKICTSEKEAIKRVYELLEKVGVRPEQASRYPHQFSGGQRQRIGIARTLALNPKLIVADEPVSALDVSIQAQILNLLMDLKDEFGLSYLFIAHDLSVVKHISDKVGVMYLGQIMEKGLKEDIFNNPLHPYTQLLLDSAPNLHGENIKNCDAIEGEIPSPLNLPKGCFFHERCPKAFEECKNSITEEIEVTKGHFIKCNLYKRRES